MDRETRAFVLQDIRVEQRAEGKGRTLVGHAAVFNALSEDLGGFREIIAPGAFAEAIGRDDVRALFNHDSNHVLGRNKSGTLRLAEDEKGLRTEIDLPDTQLGRDLAHLLERGDVSQMSFAFGLRKEDQDWKKEGDGPWMRTIRRVARLYDVSPVTFPAYPQTDAAVRALREAEDADREAFEAARRASPDHVHSQVAQLQRARLRLLAAGL